MGAVIVDAAWYVEGRRTLETDAIEKLAAERGGTGFGWLGLRMPSEAELDAVRDAFDLPELAIDDARQKHDRPKVERHDDCLLTVVPTARYVDEREEVEFGELFLFAGRDYLLSVRYGHAAPLAGVRAELEADPDVLAPRARGPSSRPRCSTSSRSYEPVVEGLEHDVREVERDVFSEVRTQPTKRIYFLIREVLDFLVALEPMSAAVKRLVSMECIPVGAPRDRAAVPRRRRRPVGDRRAGPGRPSAAQQRAGGELTEASMRQNEDTRTDLGVGGDRRDPDDRGRPVRHEPRRHPGRDALGRLRHRRRPHGRRLPRPLPAFQATPTGSDPAGERRARTRAIGPIGPVAQCRTGRGRALGADRLLLVGAVDADDSQAAGSSSASLE